jgi:protein-tyrosine phosphatase
MAPLHAIQQARLSRFKVADCVDVHCHILPGVDDGPAKMDDALALARAIVRDGTTTVIATPHQLGRLIGKNAPSEIRRRVASLQETLDQRRIPLRILPGGEVRIDVGICGLLRDDEISTLADKHKHLLLELPTTVAIDPAAFMPTMMDREITVVIAHAERCEKFHFDNDAPRAWMDAGAALQVNAGALQGKFGRAAEAAAWRWLSMGWVSLIATDAHGARARRPRMTEAIDAIAQKLGESVARHVCIDNPIRIAEGKKLKPAPLP